MSPSRISCESPAPPLPSNNDITGIGVIINYIATAGLAILLIMVYYLIVHEPARDPFRVNAQETGGLFRPNPVDKIILQSFRGAMKHTPLIKHMEPKANKKIEIFFLKSIVAMSDLQVVTGLAILISGFCQLHSGLATYYWILLVYLAWFSCITHLSCLTLLRNHLYNNGLERGWRLVAMATLAILEVIGLGLTGDYDWAFCSDCHRPLAALFTETVNLAPAPNDYAICFMSLTRTTGEAFPSMVASIALILFGFLTRVAKLYKPLSVGVFDRLRAFLSRGCRMLLRRVYVCSSTVSYTKKTLRSKLLYLPLLSIFLMGRFLLDQWCSLYLEVFWLNVSFSWGISNVLHIIKKPEALNVHIPDDNYNWSFGQVVSVLLLVAPVVSLMESFSEINGTESDTEVTPRQVHNSHSPQSFREDLPHSPINKDPMDPDNDWDFHQPTLKAAFTYFNMVFIIIYVSLMTLPIDNHIRGLFEAWIVYGTFLAPVLGLFGVIFFSLSIEPYLSQGRTVIPTLSILFVVLSFTTSIAWIAIRGADIIVYTGLISPFFMYFVFVMIRYFNELIAGNSDDSRPASQV